MDETVRNLKAKLDELGIPYVVVDGMALTAHGYARSVWRNSDRVRHEDHVASRSRKKRPSATKVRWRGPRWTHQGIAPMRGTNQAQETAAA